MNCPHRLYIPIPPTDYYIEVDVYKGNCSEQAPFCYISRFNKRCAKILLENCKVQKFYAPINYYDLGRILDIVSANVEEIREVYIHNSKYGF